MSSDAEDPSARASTRAPSRAYVRFGKRKVPVPRSKAMRTVVGVTMVVVGALPGLPTVAGVPVGLMLLSVDYPGMRRRRRRLAVWSGRRFQRRKPARPSKPDAL